MPQAEVIAIGTEILLGKIVDTNTRFISEELARLGIDCFFHTTVGDNKDRLVEVLRRAAARSDIVITTGGLGPTPDDLTVECIADAFGSELELDVEVVDKLRQFFRSRGIKDMPANNEKQAMRPKGAAILPNPTGTAPGIIWELVPDKTSNRNGSSGTVILTFPGVPRELEEMWRETASDYLMRRMSHGAIYSVDLKHIGIGESALAEMYSDLLCGSNPTVAPYAGRGECKLRVAAKGKTEAQARALVEPVVETIKERSGRLCYGEAGDTLESVVGRLLAEHQLTVACAESCTGGLLSTRLTDVAGSSTYISLNLVTYSNEAKIEKLGVPKDVIEEHGAVSSQCAEMMAREIRRLADSDIGIGITGIAGPSGGTEAKPVGLVFVGLDAGSKCMVKRLDLGERSTRREIRYRTASQALNMLRLFLLEHY